MYSLFVNNRIRIPGDSQRNTAVVSSQAKKYTAAMKYIGAHVSASGGVHHAPQRAAEIGATAFALFTKNQKRWDAKPLDPAEIDQFAKTCKEAEIDPKYILPHDSYLINLSNPDAEKREKSVKAFIDEAKRAEQLGLRRLNFHPGTHLQELGESEALDLIAEGMDRAMKETDSVVLVAETTAGQGSSLGYRFEHLRDLLGTVRVPERAGVCIDTCHIFAAGYDIRDTEAYEQTTAEFEKIVGFANLKGVHLNDAKSEFESRVDRHASIGKGNIGLLAFELLMNDPRFDDIPMVLETPDPEIWPEEIKTLYSMIKT